MLVLVLLLLSHLLVNLTLADMSSDIKTFFVLYENISRSEFSL